MSDVEDLVAFLLARLGEDRGIVLRLRTGHEVEAGTVAGRLESKLEAQTALIAMLRRALAGRGGPPEQLPEQVLMYLSSAYRRHPDFKPHWLR